MRGSDNKLKQVNELHEMSTLLPSLADALEGQKQRLVERCDVEYQNWLGDMYLSLKVFGVAAYTATLENGKVKLVALKIESDCVNVKEVDGEIQCEWCGPPTEGKVYFLYDKEHLPKVDGTVTTGVSTLVADYTKKKELISDLKTIIE